MKKRILALAMVLALVAALVAPAALVFAESGSVTIAAGAVLSVDPNDIVLTPVSALTGGELTAVSASGINSWIAIDPKGSGAGWNLTIISTNFVQANEVQTISANATLTAGTYTLTYSGNTTGAIQYNAVAGDVETALEAISNIESVTVTGGPLSAGTPVNFVVTFVDPSGNLPLMTVTPTDVTGGTISIAQTTKGKGIDISESDQEFQIQLTEPNITYTEGNTKPVSSVTALTPISSITPAKFIAAAVDTGMGTYTLAPNFLLEIPAETYAGDYTATFTVAIVSGP